MEWLSYCKSFIPKISDRYKKHIGVPLNLDNPSRFTEKIQWLKVFDSCMLKANCADKIKIHEYYKSTLGNDIAIPIIGIYNNPSEIDYKKLPTKFVIKCNHGSAFNVVVTNKSKMNFDYVNKRLTNWLNYDYALEAFEFHYSLIQRKILVEEYIPNLNDIKIFCFNGHPQFVQIDRHLTERRQNFYNLAWEPMTWLSRTEYPANYEITDNKPKMLDKLVEYAKQLSAPFKLVRVDFCISGDTIYGGELTFTPAAGFQTYKGDADIRLGEKLTL